MLLLRCLGLPGEQTTNSASPLLLIKHAIGTHAPARIDWVGSPSLFDDFFSVLHSSNSIGLMYVTKKSEWTSVKIEPVFVYQGTYRKTEAMLTAERSMSHCLCEMRCDMCLQKNTATKLLYAAVRFPFSPSTPNPHAILNQPRSKLTSTIPLPRHYTASLFPPPLPPSPPCCWLVGWLCSLKPINFNSIIINSTGTARKTPPLARSSGVGARRSSCSLGGTLPRSCWPTCPRPFSSGISRGR